LLTILIVALYLEHHYRIHLYKSLDEKIKIVSLFFVIGVVWDTYAIARGLWVFPDGKNLGVKIGLMPLEEFLFIFIVPYAILTFYKVIDLHSRRLKKKK
jgi:lycopene cyclase domain-containing protein